MHEQLHEQKQTLKTENLEMKSVHLNQELQLEKKDYEIEQLNNKIKSLDLEIS